MHWLSLAFFTFTLGACATSQSLVTSGAPLTSLSILQGYTNKSSTQFTVLVPKGKPLTYFTRADSDEGTLELRDITVQRFERSDSEWAVDKIKVSQLEPNRSYGLEIRDAYGELIDSREFYALDLDQKKVRFAAASCMDSSHISDQKLMWGELLNRKPQIVFLLGDNVYASYNKPILGSIKPAAIWQSYVQSRLTLDYFKANTLIPTLAIWDDGDFGVSDGNRDFDYRKESAEIFRTFYGQEPDFTNLIGGPGISNFFIAFQMGFALMDDRYYRSPNNESDDNETHWGAAQERWLLQNLADFHKPLWLLNGDQIFGGYQSYESYEGNHPENFKLVIPQIGQRTEPTLFLSGDRHLTEIIQIDEPKLKIKTFEITTSPMHARLAPTAELSTPNSRRLEIKAGKNNFVIVESENKNGNLNATVTSFSSNNEILFHRFLSVEKGTKKLTTF